MGQAAADLGLALIREGRWDEALTWLRRAVELEPEAAGAVIRLRKSEPFTVRPAHGNVLSLPHLLESEVRNAAITLDLGASTGNLDIGLKS